MSALTLAPWALPELDPYPERRDPEAHWLDGLETLVLAPPRALAAALRGRRAWAVVRTGTLDCPHKVPRGAS